MPLRIPDFRFHLRRVPALWRRWRERGRAHYSILSLRPPIFYLRRQPRVKELLRNLRDVPADYLLSFYWTLEEGGAAEVARELAEWEREFPRARFHCVANTPAEVAALRDAGRAATLCSAAAFTDERIWKPDPAASPPEFDAILDAQLAPYKRLELAAEVPRLAVVSFSYAPSFDRGYAARVEAALARAHWLNHPLRPGHRFLATPEVLAAYRRARCGLCLSPREGACKASLQGLLAGLPVVSTPSLGGRDVFYNAANALVVPPEPAAVRDAVAAWRERDPAPEAVRAATLPLVLRHRENFIALVNSILRDRGAAPDFAERWPEIFFDRLVASEPLSRAVRSVRTGRLCTTRQSDEGW